MNEELLKLLVCPRCRGNLTLITEDGQKLGPEKGLACATCAVLYPIRDQIPIMLVEEAQPFTSAEDSANGKKTSCACS